MQKCHHCFLIIGEGNKWEKSREPGLPSQPYLLRRSPLVPSPCNSLRKRVSNPGCWALSSPQQPWATRVWLPPSYCPPNRCHYIQSFFFTDASWNNYKAKKMWLRKDFFTVSVAEHWHSLSRKVMTSPTLETSKAVWTESWATTFSDTVWAEELDWKTPEVPSNLNHAVKKWSYQCSTHKTCLHG